MSRGKMYAKMAGIFALCSIGGPAIMYYVTPSEGELFKRFSPELQKRNLDMRDTRQKNYEEFVSQLKEYSKSDKPSMPVELVAWEETDIDLVWEAAAEAQQKVREDILRREAEQRQTQSKVREQMRAEAAKTT